MISIQLFRSSVPLAWSPLPSSAPPTPNKTQLYSYISHVVLYPLVVTEGHFDPLPAASCHFHHLQTCCQPNSAARRGTARSIPECIAEGNSFLVYLILFLLTFFLFFPFSFYFCATPRASVDMLCVWVCVYVCFSCILKSKTELSIQLNKFVTIYTPLNESG